MATRKEVDVTFRFHTVDGIKKKKFQKLVDEMIAQAEKDIQDEHEETLFDEEGVGAIHLASVTASEIRKIDADGNVINETEPEYDQDTYDEGVSTPKPLNPAATLMDELYGKVTNDMKVPA